MFSLQSSIFSKPFSIVPLGGVLLLGSLVIQQSPIQAQQLPPGIAPPAPTNPIGPRPTDSGSGGIVPTADFLPAYTTTNSGRAASPVNPSSYGFFFDVSTNVQLDGLGFASQPGWGNFASYDVKLWSFVNAGATPADYKELASATFTHGNPYTFKDGYFWQSLSPLITLPESFASDPTDQVGYLITAIGDFSGANGNVQLEGGTATFDPRFLNAGNSYNDIDDCLNSSAPPCDPDPPLANGFYPIPIYDGGIGSTGYFNANLSYVPGPLPVLGAAAGFGWSRRLRKRIRASK